MSKDFQYDLKEYYIEPICREITGDTGFKLHPGHWAPSEWTAVDCPKFSFGLYETIPNSLYLMPYVKTDNARVTLYSRTYDSLSGMLNRLLDGLNIHLNNFGLPMPVHEKGFLAQIEDNFKIHEVSARATSLDQKEFIEGTIYFAAILDIMVQYVEL